MKKVLFNHAIKSIFFLNILLVILIVGFIFIKGYKIISLKFLFTMPYNSMTEGGIFPALVGTFLLTSLSIIFALPPGVITAIYLNEYVKNKHCINIIKISINTLAGVPSVVFGLFGFSVFVKFFGFGVSLLSGAFTLSILILPIFISATIEALSAVPYSLREASMALGATKLYTIRHTVLPAAFSSIMTAIILSTGRAAGETAPILFTAAVFFQKNLPDSLFSPVMALPYHIYALMTEGTHPEKQVAIAYGSALVLIITVLFLISLAVFLREKRRRYVNFKH
jgi:phosphate transport system permease protein